MKKIIWVVLAAATLGVSAPEAQAYGEEKCGKCIIRKCNSYMDCGSDLESTSCFKCIMRNCSYECGN